MKIDLGKEFGANLVVSIAQERFDNEVEIKNTDNLELKKAAEKNSLYYWILVRLYNNLTTRTPVCPYARIKVKGQLTCYNKVLLTQGQGKYLPYYVEGTEFFDVIEDVLKIFDNCDKYTVSYNRLTDEICEFSVSF